MCEQDSLAQVTVWCFGEYGDMLVNHANELEGEDPQTVSRNLLSYVLLVNVTSFAVEPFNIVEFCLNYTK